MSQRVQHKPVGACIDLQAVQQLVTGLGKPSTHQATDNTPRQDAQRGCKPRLALIYPGKPQTKCPNILAYILAVAQKKNTAGLLPDHSCKRSG